jgi:hypothetical protein
LRYERRVHGAFAARFSPESRTGILYVPCQWITFVAGAQVRWAQPDGLIVDFKRAQITVIEIKLRHMQKSWWWLRHIYEPLIRYLFGPRWRYAVCEVVRWFDPGLPWPEPIRFAASPAILAANEFGVHIWNDRRLQGEESAVL